MWASFAQQVPGIPPQPLAYFPSSINLLRETYSWDPDYQRVMLWWNQITLRIKEAALHEAAYQVIKQHQGWDTDSQGKWAACKVSNYESVGLTGGITSAGRRHQIRHAPSTIPAISPYRRSPNSPATYVSESSSVSDTLPEVWAKHGAFPSRLWNNFDAGGGFIVSGEWGQPSRP